MTNDPRQSVETPSGKDAAYENFPVGSWLLPARLRPHIAVFYRFARAIDDIADNPELDADDKLRRLEGFENAVLGHDTGIRAYETAHRMRESLAATGVRPDHCVDLIAAFKQDATKSRYADWDDLMGYCVLSAAPVGRYLLDLHGGSRDGYAASDALCMGLQVINHLQDCKDDYLQLARVYLPMDWMAAEGVEVTALAASMSSPAMRRVLDHTLDATEALLRGARPLPGGLKSRRLAMEAAATLAIADRLCGLLRSRDPLGPRRVRLSKAQFLACCAKGVVGTLV
jgi:hydroxysqualene synthase